MSHGMHLLSARSRESKRLAVAKVSAATERSEEERSRRCSRPGGNGGASVAR